MKPEERVAEMLKAGCPHAGNLFTQDQCSLCIEGAIRAAVEAERERILRILGKPSTYAGSFSGEAVFGFVLTVDEIDRIRNDGDTTATDGDSEEDRAGTKA